MRVLRLFIFLGLFLATSQVVQAESFAGRVQQVTGCDTLRVMNNNRVEVVRLAGLTCPQPGEPFAREAREYAEFLVAGQVVRVKEGVRDRWRRVEGMVYLPDGRALNALLLGAGYARALQSRPDLKMLEDKARIDMKGMWGAPRSRSAY